MFGGDIAEEHIHGQDRRSKQNTDHPLCRRERFTAKGRVEPRHLNQRYLGKHCAHNNADEERVAQDALKHIDFIVDLAAVDLVEALQQNEDVEDYGVMLCGGPRRSVRVLAEVVGAYRYNPRIGLGVLGVK